MTCHKPGLAKHRTSVREIARTVGLTSKDLADGRALVDSLEKPKRST
jgi:hypothetical protein